MKIIMNGLLMAALAAPVAVHARTVAGTSNGTSAGGIYTNWPEERKVKGVFTNEKPKQNPPSEFIKMKAKAEKKKK